MTNKQINQLFLEDCKALIEARFDNGYLGDFIESNSFEIIKYLAEKLGSQEEPETFEAIRVFYHLYQE